MMVNADLDFDEDNEMSLQEQQMYMKSGGVLSQQKPTTFTGLKMSKKEQMSKIKEEEMDDEDRYLEEILNRNYGGGGKAPPAVN